MKPVSPVIKGFEAYEIQVGAGQKQYIPIPTVVSQNTDEKDERRFMSRWDFTPFERELIAKGGSILFQQLVFGEESLFNPVCFSVEPPLEMDPEETVRIMDETE
jgi:hypothetical protein